jgi:hypothetical protein
VDPTLATKLLKLLYPSETLLWLGHATVDGHRGDVLVGLSAKRIVPVGKPPVTTARRKNVVAHGTSGHGTYVEVKTALVPALTFRFDRLPTTLVARFTGQEPSGARADRPAPGAATAGRAPRTGPTPEQQAWDGPRRSTPSRPAPAARPAHARRPSSATPPPPARPAYGARPSPAEPPPPAAGPGPLTWQDAEHLAAAHLRYLGFADAHVTVAGPDGGVDVVATGAAAQVKHWAQTIGAPEVQKLRGAAHDVTWAVFYARSTYTTAAVRFAETAHVALFTYTDDGLVEAASEGARQLLRSAHVLHGGAGTEPLEERAQRHGQAELDDAAAEFAEASRELMERCRRAGARRAGPAIQRLEAEVAVVAAATGRVGAAAMTLRDVLVEVGRIRQATGRVRAIKP